MLWFKDDDDFRAGMNFVAVTSVATGIVVLSFILMSNHVHFLIVGDNETAFRFINEYKRRYSMYYENKYGIKKFLRKNDVFIKEVPMDGESAERAIAYIQMNCVAANICAHPSQYPWGTGNCFFGKADHGVKRVRDITKREAIRLTHSHVGLPGDFVIGAEGFILPRSYVKVEFVESVFRTPLRMNYFQTHSSKAGVRLNGPRTASFKDQTLVKSACDLCQSLFGKDHWAHLSEDEVGVLLKHLRYRFSADVAQLARVLGTSYDKIAQQLDSA